MIYIHILMCNYNYSKKKNYKLILLFFVTWNFHDLHEHIVQYLCIVIKSTRKCYYDPKNFDVKPNP